MASASTCVVRDPNRSDVAHGKEKGKSAQSQLRACMVSYSFYESDNRVRRYAELLADQGYRVDAIALQKKRNAQEVGTAWRPGLPASAKNEDREK